jgi:hypothetical protein
MLLLLISLTNYSCSTARHLVSTTSSLDGNLKVNSKTTLFFFFNFSFLSKLGSFITPFGVSTVDIKKDK